MDDHAKFAVKFEGIRGDDTSDHIFPDFQSMLSRFGDLANMDWYKYRTVTIAPFYEDPEDKRRRIFDLVCLDDLDGTPMHEALIVYRRRSDDQWTTYAGPLPTREAREMTNALNLAEGKA